MQNCIPNDPPSNLSGMGSGIISVEPYREIGNSRSLMEILLSDHTTGSNLIWATDDYSSEGSGFNARDTMRYLFLIDPNRVIRPRYLKPQSEQRNRSRDMAEVFTPPWIVNKQNNLVDEQWIGIKDAFNIEHRNSWTVTDRVRFGDRSWEDYVTSIRMEVCCGEAPYLTTRYDSINGFEIPVRSRVGFLDRKLRVVSENVDEPEDWLTWAKTAVKSVYAYDFQGDNVLLARENLLLTFIEFYREKFEEEAPQSSMETVANILSWNIWQMDGMKMVVPFSCESSYRTEAGVITSNRCNACKTGTGRHIGKYCRIMDWGKGASVEYASMMKKERKERGAKSAKNVANTLDGWF